MLVQNRCFKKHQTNYKLKVKGLAAEGIAHKIIVAILLSNYIVKNNYSKSKNA